MHLLSPKMEKQDLTAIPIRTSQNLARQREAERQEAANIHSLTPVQSHCGEQKSCLCFCKQGKPNPQRKYNSNANF